MTCEVGTSQQRHIGVDLRNRAPHHLHHEDEAAPGTRIYLDAESLVPIRLVNMRQRAVLVHTLVRLKLHPIPSITPLRSWCESQSLPSSLLQVADVANKHYAKLRGSRKVGLVAKPTIQRRRSLAWRQLYAEPRRTCQTGCLSGTLKWS